MQLKKISTIILLTTCLFSLNSGDFNIDVVYANSMQNIHTDTAAATISPRAEQTEWKYRTVNGKIQKRLWSITKNKWLTDWKYV